MQAARRQRTQHGAIPAGDDPEPVAASLGVVVHLRQYGQPGRAEEADAGEIQHEYVVGVPQPATHRLRELGCGQQIDVAADCEYDGSGPRSSHTRP